MTSVYLIGGLGADQRVFEFIDFGPSETRFVHWIDPNPGESIQEYSRRLTTQITSREPVIIGVSFGGMIAIEIGKLIPTKVIVLVSSVRERRELPWYFTLAGPLRLNKLMPSGVTPGGSGLIYWLFGIESDTERALLSDIIKKTDPKMMSWAVEKILRWENEEVLANVITIHGTRDRVLPMRNPDFRVNGGGHFMIVNRAREVGRIIRSIIAADLRFTSSPNLRA